MLAIGRLGLACLAAPLRAAANGDPILRETAGWALARLGVAPGFEGEASMLLIEKVMLLKGVQMFEQTSEEILTEVARLLEEVEVGAGEEIFRKGDIGDSMYIVVEGQVRVYDGDRTVNVLDEKEIFGELALLDPEPRSASVAAKALTWRSNKRSAPALSCASFNNAATGSKSGCRTPRPAGCPPARSSAFDITGQARTTR